MADDRLKFHKLTPKGNVDLDVYNDAIDFAMRNSDLRNVAISGAYGSGKSSVLESYKNRHHEKKFIHISLEKVCAHGEKLLCKQVCAFRALGVRGVRNTISPPHLGEKWEKESGMALCQPLGLWNEILP